MTTSRSLAAPRPRWKRVLESSMLAVLIGAGFHLDAFAHSSWLAAEPQRASERSSIRLYFGTSDAFPISEVGTAPDRVERFVLLHGGASTPIGAYGIEGNELVARVGSSSDAGVHVGAIALRPRFIELAPDKFHEYLVEVDAEQVLQARANLKD